MHRRPRETFARRSVHCFAQVRIGAPALIPRICPLCGQQSTSKLASLYWAWTRADGRRKAFKQKVCADCFRERYVKLVVASMEPVLLCPNCGIATADDFDAVYLSYFMPGMPGDTSEMPLCGACAVEVRNMALLGATELEDRGVGTGGPQPQAPTGAEVWAALGLGPK